MKSLFIKSNWFWFVTLGFVCLALIICKLFHFAGMASNSMSPTIIGNDGSPTHHGDVVLISTLVTHPLKKSNLVEVLIGTNNVRTIRRVAGIPGDLIPYDQKDNNTNENSRIENGFYYLLGDSASALDSRQLGLFGFDKITGKVIYIFH